MAAQNIPNDIILYNYAFSPFGKRLSAYLALRGINYALCEQPFIMPRPDLELINVHYRRIPILAIGRDVYLDTRLILQKLEALPGIAAPKLGATKQPDMLVQKLLEMWMIEGPVFGMTAGLVPTDVTQDTSFIKDRQGFLGKSWSKDELDEGRGECLNYVRNMCELFESTVFADGRKWVLASETPQLADIEAIFLLDFVSDMELAKEIISEAHFPKVLAWIARYRAAVEEAKEAAPKPINVDGQAAASHILHSKVLDSSVSVDGNDPSGLKEGTQVEVYPADWGTEHRDRGRLVGLGANEVTLAVGNKEGVEIFVHAPRTGFKVREVGGN